MKNILILLSILLSIPAFAGDRVIINPDVDGDVVFKVNDNGVINDVLRLDGDISRVTFPRGTVNYVFVSTNPEVGGSTPFQLTQEHNRVQVVNPTTSTVRLPSTAVVGDVWEIYNRSASTVTVTASGGTTLDEIRKGHLKAVALTTTPTTDADWWITDLRDQAENSTSSVTPNSGTVSATCAYSVNRSGSGPVTQAGSRAISIWMKCSGTVTSGSPVEVSFTSGIPARFAQSNSAYRTQTLGGSLGANQVTLLKVEESGILTLGNLNVSTGAQVALAASFDLRAMTSFARQ